MLLYFVSICMFIRDLLFCDRTSISSTRIVFRIFIPRTYGIVFAFNTRGKAFVRCMCAPICQSTLIVHFRTMFQLKMCNIGEFSSRNCTLFYFIVESFKFQTLRNKRMITETPSSRHRSLFFHQNKPFIHESKFNLKWRSFFCERTRGCCRGLCKWALFIWPVLIMSTRRYMRILCLSVWRHKSCR